MKARYLKHTLNFKKPAGTSRGVLENKDTYFIVIESDTGKGLGEVNLFRGLSIDDRDGFEKKLQWTCDHITLEPAKIIAALQEWPSILFGYEMAIKSFQSTDPFTLFPSPFTEGVASININGLIWMGQQEDMLDQIQEKINAGFDCIKMKIGAIDFETELELLRSVRSRFRESEITLRVDANGAFKPAEAMEKLQQLADYSIHSIEQPIKHGQWEDMARLCEESPVDIALDEELIGLYTREQKLDCLQTIQPQYIILKPALIGGFASSREWVDLALRHKAGWWITSALESNVGLNAIAQFAYTLGVQMPQGLGTGSLFTNNIPAPLHIERGNLWCNKQGEWNTNEINF
ncbi:MAG: o-succinylbenzoate synthase [Nonlabens sp.]